MGDGGIYFLTERNGQNGIVSTLLWRYEIEGTDMDISVVDEKHNLFEI